MGIKATSFIGNALTAIAVAEGHLHNAYLATPVPNKDARKAISKAEDILSDAVLLVARAIIMNVEPE